MGGQGQVRPSLQVSATTAYSCCCDVTPLWYAERCDAFTENYCCDTCCTGPARIEFCAAYLVSIGVTLPPVPGFCVWIAYAGCLYELIGIDPAYSCPPGSGLYPINVGTLYAITPLVGGDCCVPKPGGHVPVGGIPEELPESQIEQATEPCEDVIAECYPFCDQFGTNGGGGDCAPVASSTPTACYQKWGVPFVGLGGSPCGPGFPGGCDTVLCDRDYPIRTYAPVTRTVLQRVGVCIPDMTQQVFGFPLVPGVSQGRYQQIVTVDAECGDCQPMIDFCCPPFGPAQVPDPCATYPNHCDGIPDPKKSYTLDTSYSLVTAPEAGCTDHVQDVLVVRFPFCLAVADGLDPFDPAQADAVRAFYLALTATVNYNDDPPCTVNTGWGIIDSTCVTVCNYLVNVFSGNAGHIADRINTRLAPFITASGIGGGGQCFWFGNRQSCQECGGGPNVRPPSTPADRIEVDRAVIDTAAQQVYVYFRGRSTRYRACLRQRYEPWDAVAIVDQASISSGCLSPAEYSCGSRYAMLQVSEDATAPQQICIGDCTPLIEVPSCEAVAGSWPYNDIEVFDPISGTWIVLVYGYESICGGGPPSTRCRVYPLVYIVEPCDTEEPRQQCVCDNVYYNPKNYCQTNGGVVNLT